MKFIVAKLYELYKTEGENARSKVASWSAVVLLFATLCFILPLLEFVNLKYYQDSLKLNRFVIFGVAGLIAFLYYKMVYRELFLKGRIHILEEKYKKVKIPFSLLLLLMVVIPVFLLLLAGTVTVLLTGGHIFSMSVKGILE